MSGQSHTDLISWEGDHITSRRREGNKGSETRVTSTGNKYGPRSVWLTRSLQPQFSPSSQYQRWGFGGSGGHNPLLPALLPSQSPFLGRREGGSSPWGPQRPRPLPGHAQHQGHHRDHSPGPFSIGKTVWDHGTTGVALGRVLRHWMTHQRP